MARCIYFKNCLASTFLVFLHVLLSSSTEELNDTIKKIEDDAELSTVIDTSNMPIKRRNYNGRGKM